MIADLSDPHWLLIWPAYALTAAGFAALVWMAAARLRKWSQAARALDPREEP